MKDNTHIYANQSEFQEAYAQAREILGKLDGVLSVGFGLKQTGGSYKDDLAIIVFVREKKK